MLQCPEEIQDHKGGMKTVTKKQKDFWIGAIVLLYSQYNRIYFDNELEDGVKINFRKFRRLLGQYHPTGGGITMDARYIEWMDTPFIKRRARVMDAMAATLLHEMLHKYETEVLKINTVHTKRFWASIDKMNGLKFNGFEVRKADARKENDRKEKEWDTWDDPRIKI